MQSLQYVLTCCTLFSVSVLLLPEEAKECVSSVVVVSQAVVFISSMNSAVSSSLNSAPSVFFLAEELNEHWILLIACSNVIVCLLLTICTFKSKFRVN